MSTGDKSKCQLCAECELKRQWKKQLEELQSKLDEYDQTHVALPLDVEGVLIHVGDVVTDGEELMPVIAIAADKVATQRTAGPCEGHIWTFAPAHLWHVKSRTIEDVLAECSRECVGASLGKTNELIARYADEIRELMGGAE